ncbi:Coenzyme Q-binding protein COQ10 START domain-containing protein (Fragment) [Madurella fahalii]|uniref:Coenzyme Q-binding protein COQ10 START domain-containing protein n=1 Tax=Madurella fahalii TaxID=1157608 RepID=A0ABQ0G1S9_9PEZI
MTTPSPSSGTTAIGRPLPTPTYGPGGSFSVTCSARIAATPKACLDVMLDAPGYPTWNRFCRKCTIDAQPSTSAELAQDEDKLRLGTQFTFDVHMDPSAPSGNGKTGRAAALEVSVLEAINEDDGRRRGWRVGWKGRSSLLMPAWMLHNERIQEFVEADGGKATEYYCWETFYGVLAPVVKKAAGAQVVKGFEVWVEGLKGKVEGRGFEG